MSPFLRSRRLSVTSLCKLQSGAEIRGREIEFMRQLKLPDSRDRLEDRLAVTWADSPSCWEIRNVSRTPAGTNSSEIKNSSFLFSLLFTTSVWAGVDVQQEIFLTWWLETERFKPPKPKCNEMLCLGLFWSQMCQKPHTSSILPFFFLL